MFLLDEGELYSIYYVINESVSLCFDEYVDMPLVVNVSDVYIDCNGSTLLGNGTGIGVYPYNVSNFRLENCTIENYAMGVLAYFVDESNIHNVSISYGEIDESEFIIAGILNYNTSATVFSEINLNYLSNQSVPLFSYISTDNTFTNISSYSASGIGVLVYFGLNNTFENIISITETDALFDFTAGAFSLLGSFNSTFINVTGESDFVGLVLEESTGNNFTDSVFIGRGDIVMGGEVCSNNFTNVNGTDDRPILFYNGAQNLDSIEASAIILCNADYSNLTDSYINNSGIWLFNTSYSNINNSDSLAWYVSIFVDENSSYNNISNMTLSTEMYETVVIEGANNRLINSSLTSFDEWAVIYNLGINSSFLHNNITGALWVEDYSDTSDYNDSTSGNRYYFANGTGSWELFEIFDLNDDNWADVGRDYPFRHETLGDYWIGNGTDWHPWTDVEPSGVYCGYEVDSDISLDANLSCFADSGLNVIADNITIDCQGYSITGDNAGIGINIRGFNNTEIINCEIENFVYGIYADDANNTFISDSYIHNNSCDGIYFYSPDVGIYLDLTVVDTILENNDGVCDDDTGIMNSFSNLDLWNSQFINNGDYGINYDGEESLTIWTIDEYALCRNNAISFRGELVFDGGYLELDNCTLSIENPETNITSEWDIDGNYTDIILGIEVEENETETFELPNSDLEIDLTANETYNFSISVRLLNSTEVNDTNPDLPIGKVPFKGITIEVKDTAYLSWAIIRVYYNPTELNDLNIDEDSLRMYYFNETSDEWELVIQQGIIKVNPRHVWGNVTHFSTYALFGEETEEDGGSPGGSSYTGGGARPVGQSPITTEEEELQIDEEELEEEIIVPEKPSEEIPDEKPIDTTKPYVPPTIEETPEEKPVISSLIIGIVLFVIIVFILFIAYRKRQIKKNPLKGKRLV